MNTVLEHKESLMSLKSKHEHAVHELATQSGYIEGTLDTLITMMMEESQEVSMCADKLIKAFHSVDGICSKGLKENFEALVQAYQELIEDYAEQLEVNKQLCKDIEELKNTEKDDFAFAAQLKGK